MSFLFGAKHEAKQNKSSEQSTRALPSSWYREPALYELERRAIFSKRWLLVTHRSRLSETGAYLRYEAAGFAFFLCLDHQGNLNGFHNICRHRAHPVVREEVGNASILSCSYHGWSYGLNGKLAKAPRFDTVPTFDKAQNGLFPIHVHTDARGFVWVNLDADEIPATSWEEDFEAADTQARLSDFNMDDFTFDHAWNMDGEYNWKTLADNYNECYHCGTAHPGIAAISDLTTYDVETEKGQIRHFVKNKAELDTDDKVAPTFFFPNASVTMTGKYFYLMRVVPTSAITTSMQYEVYRHKDATDEEFREMDGFFKQVESEDKALCNAAQKNLNSGTYVSGDLHPFNEKGVLHFQKLVKKTLMEHRSREEQAGTEIWPARKSALSGNVKEELQFCQKLACNDESLAW